MKTIVLMAGDGTRFAGTEFHPYKPFIEVHGKTILDWTMSSMEGVDLGDLTFAIRSEHNAKYGVANELSRKYPKAKFVYFPNLTRGNLETAMMTVTAVRVRWDDELLILDSDNFFHAPFDDLRKHDGEYAGLVYFAPIDDSPKWCFAMADGDRVTDLREKDPEALKAGGKPMVGVFYYSSASLFYESADMVIFGERQMVRNEFFMSQSIKRMLSNGKSVYGIEAAKVIPLGTPEDVRAFQSIKAYENLLRP